MNPEKLKKLEERVRTGGKGSVRRKRKAIHRPSSQGDRRLQDSLKRLGVNPIADIEEVNMFMDDGSVIHFKTPKVQASIQANTYVISGGNETKKLQELLPGIINQLGPDNLADLKRIAESYGAGGVGVPGGVGGDLDVGGDASALASAAAALDGSAQVTQLDDDDDVPDLVDNFEEVAAGDDNANEPSDVKEKDADDK